MIRKLALTTALVATMATPVVAQGGSSTDTLTSNQERIVSSVKVAIAAVFCEDYAKVSSQVIRMAVRDAADVYVVSADRAAEMLYDIAEDVWTSTPVSGEPALCLMSHFEVNEKFTSLNNQ